LVAGAKGKMKCLDKGGVNGQIKIAAAFDGGAP
jgi:hypothetical protein